MAKAPMVNRAGKGNLDVSIDPKTYKKRPKPVKLKGRGGDPFDEGQASSLSVIKKAKGGMVKGKKPIKRAMGGPVSMPTAAGAAVTPTRPTMPTLPAQAATPTRPTLPAQANANATMNSPRFKKGGMVKRKAGKGKC